MPDVVKAKLDNLWDGALTVSIIALALKENRKLDLESNLTDQIRTAIALTDWDLEHSKKKLKKIIFHYLDEEAKILARELVLLQDKKNVS